MHRFVIPLAFLLATAPLHGQTAVDVTGAQIFATAGCVHCHGEAGLGTANAPSLRAVRRHGTAAQISQQIANGGQTMPAFGEILDTSQVDRLVTFLLSADAWKGKPKGPESAYKAPPLAPVAQPTSQ